MGAMHRHTHLLISAKKQKNKKIRILLTEDEKKNLFGQAGRFQ